jgi:serine/threonine-protein kinase
VTDLPDVPTPDAAATPQEAATPAGTPRATPSSGELTARLRAHLGTAYAIERELTGGMSRVFVAHDRALGRDVVVKVLAPDLAASVSVARFRREIMLSASLQHPNIVPVLSAGEVEGLPYFVMPYVRGESLRARLQRGPLSTRETVHVLRDVGRALAFAHARGVVHRDIKPDNILLSSGAATVADFGVAKAIVAARAPRPTSEAATEAGISLGTPAYMAPEQCVADPHVDHRADLYALGVVGYEMLVGTPPFGRRAPHALLRAHLTETPVPIATRRYDVPPELDRLVTTCLMKAPEDRPKSAAALLQQLDWVAGSLDAPVTPAPAAGPDARGRRTFVRGVGAGIGLAAVVVLGVGVAGRVVGPADAGGPAPRAAPVAGAADAGADAGAGAGNAVPAPTRVIRVGALRAAGDDTMAAAVATGLESELAGAISRLPSYRVATGRGPATAGAGADLVVEGVVQRAGGRLRVSLRVVEVRGDSVVWATQHAAAVDSAFALQDVATRAVTIALSMLRPAA